VLHPSVDTGNGWLGVFLSTSAFSLGCALCVGLLNGDEHPVPLVREGEARRLRPEPRRGGGGGGEARLPVPKSSSVAGGW
jgi:hypothetical protein